MEIKSHLCFYESCFNIFGYLNLFSLEPSKIDLGIESTTVIEKLLI